MSYIPRPKPCYLDGMQYYQVIDHRKVYKYADKYYTWDELHGEIEVFNKFGYHIAVLDPTGAKKHDAVRGRKINV